MNKNGIELSLQTIAILILVILVVVTLIIAYQSKFADLFDVINNLFLD